MSVHRAQLTKYIYTTIQRSASRNNSFISSFVDSIFIFYLFVLSFDINAMYHVRSRVHFVLRFWLLQIFGSLRYHRR